MRTNALEEQPPPPVTNGTEAHDTEMAEAAAVVEAAFFARRS